MGQQVHILSDIPQFGNPVLTNLKWAHITAQPEVDDAVKQVQVMHEYFTYLEKLVEKQRQALQMLHDVEAELSLFYQQKG